MITHITETEQRLTHTLQVTTEALKQVTAERDALAESDKGLREVVENLQAGIKHWRDEWSDRCYDNQGLVNERDALRDALEDALEVMENEGPVFWQEVQDKSRAVLKSKS